MTYYKWLGARRTAYTGFQWPECGEWQSARLLDYIEGRAG